MTRVSAFSSAALKSYPQSQPSRPARPARPRLQVVQPRRRARGRAQLARFLILLLLLAVVGMLAHLYINTALMEGAFKVQQLQAENTELVREQQLLEQEVAQLESPAQIAAQAKKLKLVRSDGPQYLILGGAGTGKAAKVAPVAAEVSAP